MTEGKGHSAVRAMKRPRLSDGQPWQKLELFPTPPWATRALFEHVLPMIPGFGWNARECIEDPCAGLGHMSSVLAEYSQHVIASDVMIYKLAGGGTTSAFGIHQRDFLNSPRRPGVDWIIANPPFEGAAGFFEVAIHEARVGVALFERIQWLESDGRFEEIFSPHPPALFAPFVERVPICEGGYDPEGSTATMYAWFVWTVEPCRSPYIPGAFPTALIPPGRRAALTKPSDAILAQRSVPGFIPPSQRRKTSRPKTSIQIDGDAA